MLMSDQLREEELETITSQPGIIFQVFIPTVNNKQFRVSDATNFYFSEFLITGKPPTLLNNCNERRVQMRAIKKKGNNS